MTGELVPDGVGEVTLVRVCWLFMIVSDAGVTDVDGSDTGDSDGVTWATWLGCVPSGDEGLEAAVPLVVAVPLGLAAAVVVSSPRTGPVAAWRSLLVFTSVGTCSVKRNPCSAV